MIDVLVGEHIPAPGDTVVQQRVSVHRPLGPSLLSRELQGGLDDVGLGAVIERAADALGAAAALLGDRNLTLRPGESLNDLADALSGASSLVARRLQRSSIESPVVDHASFMTTAVELARLSAAVREASWQHREARVAQLAGALARLRRAPTVAALAYEVPREVGRLGYGRGMFSYVEGLSWTPCAGFGTSDEVIKETLRLGAADPGQVGRERPETRAVRLRTAVLVSDTREERRLHRRLIDLNETTDYVVAPVVVRNVVVGLVHGDRPAGALHVTAFDRDLIAGFAEAVGGVVEQVRLLEELGRLRNRMQEQVGSVGNLIDGLLAIDGVEPAAPSHRERSSPVGVIGPPASLSGLTRRELEVLRHLAEHRTNAEIAAALYVSPGTAKTHVQNVLRKLGVDSRTAAAQRFRELVDAGRSAESGA